MLLSISDIHLSDKHRKVDQEKVAELARSIQNVGLIHPITITSDHRLIAGAHRLNALKSLGCKKIDCVVLDVEPLCAELAEIDENLVRSELNPISIGELAIRRDEILRSLGRRAKCGDNQHSKGGAPGAEHLVTTAAIADRMSLSQRTLQENMQLAGQLTPLAKEVVRRENVTKKDALKLSRMEPDQQNAIAAQFASGKAKSLIDARRLVAKESVIEPMPLSGDKKYRVIYADPPWKYNNKLTDGYGAAENHYPTMSIDELRTLPVAEMAEKNAVLFLWTTSPLLKECFDVINAWGFKYKTSFVWDKVRHNMGHYNSVRHELLLVCTKGSCTPDVSKLFDSVVVSERSDKHSEKPEVFRQMIDTLYTHGKKLELFARKKTTGWDVWGNQA